MTAPRFWSHTDRSYPFILKDSLIQKSFYDIRYKLGMYKSHLIVKVWKLKSLMDEIAY